MIEFKSICMNYGNFICLDKISGIIPKGKITSIIGENGSGKSTLFSILTGHKKPIKGQVLLEGIDISKIKKQDFVLRVSSLMQSNNLNDLFITVRELITMGRFPHSRGKINEQDKRIIEKTIKVCELESIADKYISQLSGGQIQKAFIGMTFAQDTEYIFLDEPFAALDIKVKQSILKLIKKINAIEKKTIIMIVHDINLALNKSDYIIALKDKGVCFEGEPSTVITKENIQKLYEIDEVEIRDHDKHKHIIIG